MGLEKFGSKVSQEIHLTNLAASISETEARGQDATVLKREMADAFAQYSAIYGKEPDYLEVYTCPHGPRD